MALLAIQSPSKLLNNFHDLVEPAEWFNTKVYRAELVDDELVHKKSDLHNSHTFFFDLYGRIKALYRYDDKFRNIYSDRRAYDSSGELYSRFISSVYNSSIQEQQINKIANKTYYQIELHQPCKPRRSVPYRSNMVRIQKSDHCVLECSEGAHTQYLFNDYGQLIEERYTDPLTDELEAHRICEYEGKTLIECSRNQKSHEPTRSTFKEVEVDCYGNWTQRIQHDEINNCYYIWERIVYY